MLSKQNCVAVKSDEIAIEEKVAKAMLGQVSGWALAHAGTAIFRKYNFSDFDSAFELVNKIVAIAQEQNHHPDINFGWGYVKIRLMTHDVSGLHKNDFIMAAKINDTISNSLECEMIPKSSAESNDFALRSKA